MSLRATAALLVAVPLLAVATASPAAAREGVTYQPPVDAPVVDPFRAPATRYGPGNRGLTYDLAEHTPVRAAAEGTVVFAGWVADTQHVTVLHADGLRSSYSFLAEVSVERGRQVRRGDIVGFAGTGFHLGVRDGDTYLDPAGLFDASVVHVRLVPHHEPLPPTDAGLLREQSSLRDLVRTERPGLLRRVVGAVAGRAAPIVGRWVDVVEAGFHTWTALAPPELAYGIAESLFRHLLQDCTPSSVHPPRPPGERVALLVAGLGSSSEHGAIDAVDLDALGYDRRDVLRYSYGGGRVPADGSLHPALAGIPDAPYAPADTLGDIVERGRELARLVEQTAAARPGVPIDLYAHSMGGLVTRVALLELAERPGALDVIGQVVTIGSPHRGADLATLAVLAEKGFAQDVRHARTLTGIEIDPWSPAVRQMAETSGLVHRLDVEGVPDGVALRTVAARGDLVVTADKAVVPGHLSAVIDAAGPTAHDRLPGHPATTRELQLGLAGLAPACQSLGDAVLDAVVPIGISAATDVAGLVSMLPA